MAGPEADIQKAIVERLQAAGVLVLFLQLAGGRGFPDITAMWNGKIVCVEVKRLHGGRVSRHQYMISEALHEAGITVYFANSVDICELVLADLEVK